MFERILKNAQLRRAADRLAPGESVKLAGVWGSGSPLVVAALGRLGRAPVLLVVGHLDAADEAADDIEVFTGRPTHLFPAWEVDVGTDHVNDEIAGERLRVCNLLTKPQAQRDERAADGEQPGCDERADVIVAPVMALLQPVPSADALAEGRLSLGKGDDLSPEDLAAWLVDAGFERVDQVDGQGEFARRGGIVDVLPAGSARAIRAEFFGDRVESVRLFDLDTQRSSGEIDACELQAVNVGRVAGERADAGLLSYLPPETILCIPEPGEVFDLASELYDRIHSNLANPQAPSSLHRPDEIFEAMKAFAAVELFTFSPKRNGGTFDLGIRSLARVSVNTREALTELGELSAAADVWVYCENPAERRRFGELLSASHPELADQVNTAVGHVHNGFHWPDERLVIVGHHEVFHRYERVRRIRRVRAGRPIESMLDLTEGDYVVHVAHGIARFAGLKRLQRDGRTEEFLALRFAGGTVLHVPAGRIELVQKYIGSRKTHPNLSTLGGSLWPRQKQRAEQAVRDLAAEMIRVQAMRRSMEGISYPDDTAWQKQFADEFLYSETEDQLAAMQQLDADMSAAGPMDRLLCGDVGYGKTELAMRAAFKVAESGRQVAVLVPTTVLAEQHYRTFTERFADYPIEIEMLSRFRTAGEQSRIVKNLAQGRVDVLIGTHRLLSGDVRFADLGLIVIDEEQRFGVEHKERLKGMRATVDVLTMTATPIPRTLHMALLGLRDISSLATPPLDRRAIHTEVLHYDDQLIRQSVLRELNRQGQVFFVHNRVLDIDAVTRHVRSLAPEARVEFAHGQMAGGQLERIMLRFVQRDIDVLVCTTIIESGLDIPTANTMIIHDADRFGLAELHQLRGRVGRYKHHAFCYLLLPETRNVSPAAARRLKAIEEFSDLGAGFQIAMRDLEIRGAGNILGKEQSGHIAAVGYELYCRLLEQAVGELKGRPPRPREVAHVELGLDAYIPRSYIPADRQRMEMYRRLAACANGDELRQLLADLADAYGPVPPVVETMLDLAEARMLAWRLGIESIVLMPPDVIFAVRDFSRAEGAFAGAVGSVRLPDEKTVHWRPPPAYLQMPTLLNVLLKRLRQACEAVQC